MKITAHMIEKRLREISDLELEIERETRLSVGLRISATHAAKLQELEELLLKYRAYKAVGEITREGGEVYA